MPKRARAIFIGLAGFILLVFLILQIPLVHAAAAWRFEKFTLYVSNIIHPIGPPPTPMPVPPVSVTKTAALANINPTVTSAIVPTPTLEPLPAQVKLQAPPYEYQSPNNCGPAALSMALHVFGWEGNQSDIANEIKPVTGDRNVNPEELAYYVRNEAGWLNIEYRVGGNLTLLKRLLAHQYPVIIEGASTLDPNDRLSPTDDLWDAHYLVITGYDDIAQTVTAQDSYYGPDQQISYSQFEGDWKPFNYLYMVIYLPQESVELENILGSDWDASVNRRNALTNSQSATVSNPEDAFAWFNLGSNLVYFDRYDEAALAYDRAREIGLPLRMFRYQFGPFLAYFHSNRNADLLALTEYALSVTEKSEETWLWYGYGLYREGDAEKASAAWNKALTINPKFYDDQARKALALLGQ